jgi:predicted dehydrogenase
MGQCAHLKNYATLDSCEVAAIAELRPGLARRVANRYGVPKVYGDHADMIASEKLDGIVASQPFNRHGILVPELLKAGVPIFTEKPLAASIDVGERILKTLKSSGTWHMIGYHKRCDPATVFAKTEIDRLKQTGELGKLKYVRITMPTGDWIAGGFNDLLRSDEPMPAVQWDPPAPDMDQKTFGEYTSFVNYYIHQVNLMRHLLGESYRPVFADRAGVLLVGESASGVTCTIEMTPYSTSVDWQESALVGFEKGYIKIELPAPLANNRPGRVEVYSDPRTPGATPVRTEPALPWVHAMRAQAMAFVSAIKGERKPPCDAVEAMEDLKVSREYLRLLRGV